MGNKNSGRLRNTTKIDKAMEDNQIAEENVLEEEGILVDAKQPQLIIAGVNQHQQKNPRRIVKATPPKKSKIDTENATPGVGSESLSLQDYEQLLPQDTADEDDGFEKVGYNTSSSITNLTGAAARELEQEKVEIIKSDIKQSAHDRHKVKRETEINNRRLQKTAEISTPASDVSDSLQRAGESQHPSQQPNHSSKTSNLKPNPMSRFLPAFSVEQHPEHKRSYPKQQNKQHTQTTHQSVVSDDTKLPADDLLENNSEVGEPFGKKRKPSLPSDPDSPRKEHLSSANDSGKGRDAKEFPDDSNDDGDEWWIRLVFIASSVALVVVGIALSARWKQRKIVS